MNPFPGLRPFTQDEDYLFFGREEQTIELLQRLGGNRFVAVVGTSGSGKSSLVRCGLLSQLLGGKMLGAGAAWEVAVTHPGGNPLALLTNALLEADLYDREAEHARENLLATLSRSHFGLVEAVKQADLGELRDTTNFLLVVDQFEEIFRFHEAGQTQQEVANEFVSLLLEAAAQKEVPIYVVLTMRSDFIGECGQFEGLAEMVNRGEFLIPRLTREQYKRVIEGPIKVAGGQIAPRLLQRLLNDLGQQADQLPCLQHALMRTWNVWAGKGDTEALDLDDYQRVGKMSQALSLHADEVYQSLAGDRQRALCQGMFQALTVEEANSRGIRRPQRLGRLCQILEVPAGELLPIIDAYRQSGVTFLMPSPEVELTDQTIIDISHESLMRVWVRLRQWVEEETQAAGIYHRLSESADLHARGKAGLYRDPELGIALAWRSSKRPNAAWAERYRPGFATAMGFLEASQQASVAEEQSREAARQRVLGQAQQLAEAQYLRLEQQQRSARKLRKLFAGVAVVAVIAAIACVAALVARNEAGKLAQIADAEAEKARKNAQRAEQSQQETEKALTQVASSLTKAEKAEQVARAAEEEGRKLLYTTDMRLAPFVWRDDRTTAGQLRVLLAKHIPDRQAAPLKPDLRSFEWHYYQHLLDSSAAVFSGHAVSVAGGAFTSNGQLVTLDQNGQVRRWNLGSQDENKASRRDLPGGPGAQVRALSPNGRLAGLAEGNKVHVFDSSTGKETFQINSASVRSRRLIFSRDGDRLIIVDDKIRWCNAVSGEVIASVNRKFEVVNSLALSGDGLTLAVVGHGPLLGQFSSFRLDATAKTVTPLAKDVGSVGGSLNASALSPEGRLIAVGAKLSGSVSVFDTATGRPIALHGSAHASPVSAMAFSGDGAKLATADAEGTIKIWADAHKLTSKTAALLTLKGHQGVIHTVGFSSDGKRLASGSADKTARVWDLDNAGAAIRPLERFANGASFVARFSPDGQLIADADIRSGSVRLWDAATGRLVRELSAGVKGRVYSVAFSPTDNRLLAVGYGGQADVSHVVLWNIDTGRELAHLPGATDLPDFPKRENNSAVGALAFSPDGKYLVAGFGGKAVFSGESSPNPLKVWEVAARRLIRRLNGHTGHCVSLDFSRDGTLLASGSQDGTAILWSTESWKATQTLRNPDKDSLYSRLQGMVQDVTFSPDGKTLALASREGTVQLWDVAGGKLLATLKGHSNAVGAVAFSPDGRTLASGGFDETVRLWNVETRRELMQLDSGNVELGRVQTLAFSPDGKHLLAGGGSFSGGGSTAFWSTAPVVWNDPDRAAEKLRRLLQSNADFQSRIRMLSENLRLHAALAKLDSKDVRVPAALAAAQANWHASRQAWSEAVAAFERLKAADPTAPEAWLRTPGLLRLATALLHQNRPRDAAALLMGGAKRRIADGLPAAIDQVALGMPFLTGDGSARVGELVPGSPASRSGLRAGDVILKVDDTELTRESLDKLAQLLAGEAGTKVRITVRHSGSERPEVIELTRERFVNDAATGELLHPLRAAINERRAREPRHPGLLELRAELAGQWSDSKAQAADYTAAIEALSKQTPKATTVDLKRLYGRRGNAYVGLEKWQEAVADYAHVVTRETTDEELLTNQARAQVNAQVTAMKLPERFVRLGRQNEARGLDLVDYATDGATDPAQVEGQACRLVQTGSRGWGHAYFVIENGFKWAPVMNVQVEIEYWADSSGNFRIHYDSHDNSYKQSQKSVELEGSKGWKTARFAIKEARFANSQNGRADFRFLVTTAGRFYIKRISVRRLLPGGEADDPWVQLAGVHRMRNDLEALGKLVERHPASTAAIGDSFAADKEWQRAIEIYSKAITKQTTDVVLLSKRARAYEALKNWDAAAADWSRAATGNPDGAKLLADFARRLAAGGQVPLAKAQFEKSQALYQRALGADPDNDLVAPELAQLLLDKHENENATRWTVLKPTEMKSKGGATLTKLDDDSILAGGVNPPSDQYTVDFFLPEKTDIRLIRLEALTHNSLPGKGPGRSTKGYAGVFALNRWDLTAKSPKGAEPPRRLSFRAALADYSWNNAALGLHGEWNISYGEGKDHTSVWSLPEPVTLEAGTELHSQMQFNPLPDWSDQNLGRFRLSVLSDPAALDREQKRFAAMKLTDPWAKLAAAYAVNGRNDEGSQYFSKALKGAESYEARKPILEFAARFEEVVAALSKLQPDDPQLQLALARRHAKRGKQLLGEKQSAKARAELEKSREIFARLRATYPEPQWTILTPTKMTSEGGATLTLQGDRSILASGKNPDQDNYTISLSPKLSSVTTIRLETLPMDPPRNNNSGRVGNFNLTGVTLHRESATPDRKREALRIQAAWVDYSDPNSGGAKDGAEGIIDSNNQTHWSVHPFYNQAHFALLQLEKPIDFSGGDGLTMQLHFQNRINVRQHIGRFRLSVTNDAAAFKTAQMRNDLKESEAADLNVALAKAHAQRGDTDEAVASFIEALHLAADRAAKAKVITEAGPLAGVLEKLAERAAGNAQVQAELARHFAERGNTPLANAARTKARALFEGKLAKEPDNTTLAAELADVLLIGTTRWTVLKPVEMKSEGGATLTRLDDHSVLASGTNPSQDVYTLTFGDLPARIKALRLEVLPHHSLSQRGPGRQANGNLVLTEIRAKLFPGHGDAKQTLSFRRAVATHEQPGQLVAASIDTNDLGQQGWGIHPLTGQAHSALFVLVGDAAAGPGASLVTSLIQNYGNNNTIGRCRISVTDDSTTFEREGTRLAVLKVTDPWLTLAAAYAVTGHNDGAVQYFRKALESADGYEAKKAIFEHVVGFDKILDSLAKRYPAEPQLQLALPRNLTARGKAALAAKKPADALALLKQARAIFTRLLSPRDAWTVLTPTELKSNGGETLTVEKDGSIFVTGPNPERAVYTLRLRTDLPTLTAIRLETVPDARLPEGGAGRYGNGNFHVSEFTAAIVSGQADAKPTPIEFGSAIADSQDSENTAKNMIDGNPETRWDTHPKMREAHWAVFGLKSPARIDGGSLSITLDSGITSWGKHGLGRFRLSVTNEADLTRAVLRNDLKDSEVVDLNVALAKAHAQQGHINEAVASFAEAFDLAKDRAAKAKIITQAVELAAAGQGKGEPPLDDAAKTKLRRPALDWLKAELDRLRAELTSRAKQLERDKPGERTAVQAALLALQKDSDLAYLRDAAVLAKLPADEQKSCTRFWADVTELLMKAEGAANNAAFRLPGMGRPNSWMAQDREGKWLAVPTADLVAVFDARTGKLVRTLTGHTDRVYAVAFSPDGKFLAGGNWAAENKVSTVKVWDLKTGRVTATLDSGVGILFGINFSRDGKRLFCSGPGGVQMWDFTSRRLVRSFKTAGDVGHGVYNIGLSPDGKRLVCNDTATTAKVWEIDGDNPPVTLGGHTNNPHYVAYSPDGKLLAAGSDAELLLWDASTLKLVKKIATPANWLAFTPDGKSLLTAQHHPSRPLKDDVVTRWDLATGTGKPLPPLTGRTGWPDYHLSPDGKTLYTQVVDGPDTEQRIRVYDAATGKEVEILSLQALAKRFPALLRHEDKPADNRERLDFAQIAYDQKQCAFATRLWAEALTSDPKLGDDRQKQHRYNAARAAALAAAGQGKDEPPLDDAAKAKLRRQALGWLKAELTVWTKQLESSVPKDRQFIVQALSHWQKDSDLAGIRAATALAKLPPDEQKAFTQLWADVVALLKKAQEKPK